MRKQSKRERARTEAERYIEEVTPVIEQATNEVASIVAQLETITKAPIEVEPKKTKKMIRVTLYFSYNSYGVWNTKNFDCDQLRPHDGGWSIHRDGEQIGWLPDSMYHERETITVEVPDAQGSSVNRPIRATPVY